MQAHAHLLKLRLRHGEFFTTAMPAIMGIVNVSPDSFYKPHKTRDAALSTVETMIAEGADIIDIGGEATNPFVELDRFAKQIEMERVLPVVEAVHARFDVLISVDTSLPTLMSAAVSAGAGMINDQRALESEEARSMVAKLAVPVCLMHWFDPPRLPDTSSPTVLFNQIKHKLELAIQRAELAGIAKDSIMIDPGFGQGHYGKSTIENCYLLHHIAEFVAMGYPILSGWSRKSMIGDMLSQGVEERMIGSVAADTLAAYHGAALIRTHDVRAASEATRIAAQVRLSKKNTHQYVMAHTGCD